MEMNRDYVTTRFIRYAEGNIILVVVFSTVDLCVLDASGPIEGGRKNTLITFKEN